jgi:SNF2 family DNA or RNA helicase
MRLPDFLEALRFSCDFKTNVFSIGEVNFSHSTYQIEVIESKNNQSFWVFLQFQEETLSDSFCTCDESSEKGACFHMLKAVGFVQGRRPFVHKEFYSSFWHHLFLLFFKKSYPSQPRVLKTKKECLELTEKSGEPLFLLQGHGPFFAKIEEFIEARGKETEETSIKFSNLSEREIELWREGRPSRELSYELSFFSDIAKFLYVELVAKESETQSWHEVVFKERREGFPEEVALRMQDGTLSFRVNQEELEELVSGLGACSSSLPLICEAKASIDKIIYNEQKKSFEIYRSFERTVEKTQRAMHLGKYRYVPGIGFFAPQKELKTKERIEDENAICKFLDEAQNEDTHLLREKMQGKGAVLIHEGQYPVRYALSIDAKESLCIEASLFEEGDLQSKKADFFGSWVFLPAAGFYKTAGLVFSQAIKKIAKDEVSAFLHEKRLWMNQFPGFSVHIARREHDLSYTLTKTGGLILHAEKTKSKKEGLEIDFGDWLWQKGEGFFLKENAYEAASLPFEKQIAAHQIADFIRRHHELLEGVSGFFQKECPIESVGLSITVKKKGLISILPDYVWKNAYDQKEALFFDDYVYIKNKGFYHIPAALRPVPHIREIASDDSESWNVFFLDVLPRLKQEYRCVVDPRLEKSEDLALVLKEIENKKKKATFEWDLDLSFRSKFGKVDLDEILLAKKRGTRFVPTKAGLLDLEETRFGWLTTDFSKKKQEKTTEKAYRLSSVDLLRMQAYEGHAFEYEVQKQELFERLLSFKPVTPPEYPDLQCELRPYQKSGVEWLWFLYQNGLSGLLCDDMGVGKTHQAMALISAIRSECKKENEKARFLIVCPTSLIYHWQEKIAKFCPDLRVKTYIGTMRALHDFEESSDVLLTTYGIWRQEHKKFRTFYFEAAFFDELQIAKNHVSQIYMALLDARSRMKIGLTGTPVENQLRELKALFDLVLPGYMLPDFEFREFFARPIEKEANYDRRALLARYVKPFVLRRRKADVLPDLPEKTEDYCLAELIGKQRALYQQVVTQQSLGLIQMLKDDANPIPYMHIFALLTSLKQICNHPAVYLKDFENYECYESGKWEAFLELLEEAQESEQKVVVFSQYLGMLDIMRHHLTKQGIQFAEIRGQTKDRGEEIRRFNHDPKCMVFLGSLQASGLGIDLTAASVVIHYDRWWNPARENQATDRVHRIGQTRGVQVFKMVTKESIEENIDKMIERKKGLFEHVVAFDDHQVMKRFSRQEIIQLLEGLGLQDES